MGRELIYPLKAEWLRNIFQSTYESTLQRCTQNNGLPCSSLKPTPSCGFVAGEPGLGLTADRGEALGGLTEGFERVRVGVAWGQA